MLNMNTHVVLTTTKQAAPTNPVNIPMSVVSVKANTRPKHVSIRGVNSVIPENKPQELIKQHPAITKVF